MIEIDGSDGEGGGQVLRSSLALSLLTGKAFHLSNLRARRRPKPGLQPQHLMSVRAAATIGTAQVRGASLNSTDLVFEPGKVQAGTYRFDIRTAGATGLVLHTLYLPLALQTKEASELTLVGGTHVRASPSFHFLDHTWRKYLELFGLSVALRMVRPGFYPRGGGEVQVVIQPCQRIRPAKLNNRGRVSVRGISAAAGLPEHVAGRQAQRAARRLKNASVNAAIVQEIWEGGPGSMLALIAENGLVPATFVALGERGKPAEKVADEAVDELLQFLAADPAPVDCHSADQILLPLTLADGPSRYAVAQVTNHLLTNIAVMKRFLDRDMVCEGEEGGPGHVRID
jgi:RNA 3'-terminal phosphate cyclase (ATP)